ncbi:MAG: dTDP-4-dehydrorhamnose reductase [Cytophagales bacterium]|nr:dTDP-4-dehydrorhamnose reductase [Bernardetiaceae bacterium]MDW8203693.1 dTDP-4-dehydrorhamnose reductase [Cytophagales bacterium]
MSKPVLLITGANGQLGCSLRYIAPSYTDFEFVFACSNELDITQRENITAYFERYQPTWCINTAAYTAVDKAESERERAYAVNAKAVQLLATACQTHGTAMLHISTDFVFDGSRSVPLTEEDPTTPLNYYGESKREGELLLQQSGIPHVIIRTSWLYSPYGNNFVKTMLRLGRQRGTLNVVDDQIGTPTFAEDLAHAIMAVVRHNHQEQPAYGLYHYSNEGAASWYDFAHAIFEIANIQVSLYPIPTSAYPTPARRPHYSLMNKAKIKQTFGISIPYWRDSLQRCLLLMKCR